ncbi:MAG: hypothetical protein IJ426_06250 [Clostridia bacterium]|nr:hypothetical protein [Clostridia bacterium]
MKKLFVLLFVLLLAVAVCGCGDSATKPESDPSTPESSVQSDENASKPSKITEEEAIQIASQHWGIKSGDKDEKTGFSFLIMPVEGSNGNIKIALKWLVNNQNYSTVDMVEIDPETGEILNVDDEK